MSSNDNRTYNSIYLKKSSYAVYTNGIVIKKYVVDRGPHKGKTARIHVKTSPDGKKVLKVKYSSDL